MLVSPAAAPHVNAGMASSSCSPDAENSTPDSVLSDLIEGRSWSDVLAHVRAQPVEASRVIRRSFGDILPLHEACKLQAPADVVEALIGAYPPAVRTAAGQDGSFLPLHCAMQTSSTEAVGPLLRSYPAGARKKDDRGRLPIHIGCEWRASPASVEALLVAYPECIYVRDEDGKSPMDYALNPKAKGDMSEIVAVLEHGPAYCAVSRSAYTRLKDEFNVLMKNQVKAHETAVVKLEQTHAEKLNLHRQLEEGYRSGLKSMGEQSNKFRREGQNLKKERSTLVEQLGILKNAEAVLSAHADALESRLREKKAELTEARSLSNTQETQIRDLEARIQSIETELAETKSMLELTKKELGQEKEANENLTEKTANQGAQIQDLQARIQSTENQLAETKSTLELTEKDLGQEKWSNENLTAETADRAKKIEELTDLKNSLEVQLKESRAESNERAKALQDALKCIEGLNSDNTEKDSEIAELRETIKKLEVVVEEKSADIKDKRATIESANKHIDELSSDLEAVTDQSRQQAEQITALSAHGKALKSDLRNKTKSLNETSSALSESRARMEVLLRNLDSVLKHNVCQADRIESLNSTVVTLSASMNALLLPPDAIKRAKDEQTKAMSLLLGDEDKRYLLDGKVGERRERVLHEHSAMEELIRGVKPATMAGIEWEHYIPSSPVAPKGGEDKSVGSASSASLNFEYVKKTKTLARLTSPAKAATVARQEEPVPDNKDEDTEDTEVGLYDDEDGMNANKKRDEADDATVEDVAVGESESINSSLCAEEVKSSEDREVSAQDDSLRADGKKESGAKEEAFQSTSGVSTDSNETTVIQNKTKGEERDLPGEDDPVYDRSKGKDGQGDEESEEIDVDSTIKEMPEKSLHLTPCLSEDGKVVESPTDEHD